MTQKSKSILRISVLTLFHSPSECNRVKIDFLLQTSPIKLHPSRFLDLFLRGNILPYNQIHMVFAKNILNFTLPVLDSSVSKLVHEYPSYQGAFHNNYYRNGIAVIQWITCYHKNLMITPVITFWHMHVTSLTKTVSTISFFFLEIMFTLKVVVKVHMINRKLNFG